MQVQREVHDILLGVADGGAGLDLGETVAEEPDAVDEQAVGGALDLKVAEEGVGAEQREDLVEDVVALRVRVRALGGGQGRVRDGKGVGRAADLGAEGQQGEVANQPGIGLRVEDGVVGLEVRKSESVSQSVQSARVVGGGERWGFRETPARVARLRGLVGGVGSR